MQKFKANQTQFLFVCSDLDVRTFEVVDFAGRDGISEPYRFEINLTSRDATVEADAVINRPATLYIDRGGEWYPYSGVVAEFEFIDESTDYSRYRAVLVPALWLLSLNTQSRIFQKMTAPEVVEEVLKDAGMKDRFRLDLSGSYPQREYIVQYRETDLNFISRLLETSGIWYFFEEESRGVGGIDKASRETLVITDKPASFKEITGESEVAYRSRSGMHEREDTEELESVHRLSVGSRVLPREVVCRSYNYRTPEVPVSAKAALSDGHAGSVYDFGGSLKDVDGAQKAATVESGRLASEGILLTGSGNCRGFRAGTRCTIDGHKRSDCSGAFLIREVTHHGSHGSVQQDRDSATYTNEFLLMPSARMQQFRPPRRARQPVMPGIMTATIEANGSQYAAVDDTGRYKVRLPFDISDAKNFEASKYVRLAQPYSGANYGMHFPSHEGSEMLLACVDGDPDRPVGIGTVPNANTISPVTSGNKAQGMIRTAGNNEIMMDDTDGKQKMRLSTAAKNTTELDDENQRAYIQTTNGNKILLDDKNEQVSWNADKHNITMSYKGGSEGIVITTGGGHVIKIDDNGKKINIQSNGGNSIEMDDNAGKITLADGKGKNTVTLDGSQGLILDSKGKVSIKAMQDVIIDAANISLQAKQAIQGKANTDVKLEGLNVSAKANAAFKASGMSGATVESTGSTTVKGMQTKVEGTGQLQVTSSGMAKLSASVAQLQATGPMIVKGAVVMIN